MMMDILLVTCFILCIFETRSDANISSTYATYPILRQANVVFRHGDRTPTGPYPNYDQEWYWDKYGGLGQLTPKGLRQAYELGQFLRHHYDGFMNETYSPKEIYIRSTDYDRTLMSASTLLAGLYPPRGFQIWHPDIAWQPIPIHTIPLADDYVFEIGKLPCPQYSQLQEDTTNTKQYKDKMASLQSIFSLLQNHTGYLEPVGIVETAAVLGLMIVQMDNNLTIPAWYTQDTHTRLIEDFIPWLYKFLIEGKEKITSGPLLKEVINNMFSHINQTGEDGKKMILYSAHDDSIIGQLLLLNVWDGQLPVYCASLMYELYEVAPGNFSIQILYKNETNTNLTHKIQVKGCTDMCPMETFLQIVKSYLPSDWNTECQTHAAVTDDQRQSHIEISSKLQTQQHQKQDLDDSTIRGVITLVVFMGVVVMIIGGLTLYNMRRRKAPVMYRYYPVMRNETDM